MSCLLHGFADDEYKPDMSRMYWEPRDEQEVQENVQRALAAVQAAGIDPLFSAVRPPHANHRGVAEARRVHPAPLLGAERSKRERCHMLQAEWTPAPDEDLLLHLLHTMYSRWLVPPPPPSMDPSASDPSSQLVGKFWNLPGEIHRAYLW